MCQDVGDVNSFISVFRQRLLDCYSQNWNESVKASSRCYHYKHFKTLLDVERYLIINMPVQHRYAMSRFRSSSHKLCIETGRHNNIPIHLRLCQFCLENQLNVIDCEYHVFFQCKKYEDIRSQYLFTWYYGGKFVHNFYHLLSSSNDDVIWKLAL